MVNKKADIGVIGLGVMGRNLTLNISDHGFSAAVWNYETDWVEEFISGEAVGREITGTASLQELVASLKRPRSILMMIRAGKPVDQVIEQLIPLLEEGDILIDGGNSNYHDTIRRVEKMESQGLRFVGSGVSGGEEGARFGPALMSARSCSQ
jgi:6-phosphogluconate dehydrogenase